MKRILRPFFVLFAVLAAFGLTIAYLYSQAPMETPEPTGTYAEFTKGKNLYEKGMPKDAVDVLRPWVLDFEFPETDLSNNAHTVSQALSMVLNSLGQLNRESEKDEFLEKMADAYQGNWRVLQEVADAYLRKVAHHGFIIDGKFERGRNQGGGRWADATERDRGRALQIFSDALPSALEDEDAHGFFLALAETLMANRNGFFLALAETLMANRNASSAWKLQTLTDLKTLPDYAEQRYWGGGDSRAPVDENGDPVLYGVPESFETAKNDGERWRWALEQYAKNRPDLLSHVLIKRAEFSRSQFGEQTLQEFPFFRSRQNEDETQRQASIWSLETLGDDEIIAKLATGIKRFKLSDEFHYIALYRQAAEKGRDNLFIISYDNLAKIACNRMQYEKAVGYLDTLLEKYTGNKDYQGYISGWTARRNQITGNWGRFEATGSKVAGLDAQLRYTFRNGKKVKLTAQKIKIETLLADIKAYLKSKPKQLDWNKTQIEQIGWRLIVGIPEYLKPDSPEAKQHQKDREKDRKKYLGEQVADWSVDLEPAPKHFDRQTTISVPIAVSNHGAGAYLVQAEMEDGNTEYVVLWLNDTAIVRKQLDNALLYFVADAGTGQPVEAAKLDFFGYRMEWKTVEEPNNRRRRANTPDWSFEEFSNPTDVDGLFFLRQNEKLNNFNWLVTAKNDQGRFAHLGFDGIWFNRRYDERYNEVKTFFITDRPVYRPKDTVEIKAWVGTSRYDKPDVCEWGLKTIRYEIYDPKGEKIAEKADVKLDAYGGFVDSLALPADASLGVYRIQIDALGHHGSGSFRVEEYKKPEYEVSVDAPKEPVRLGETIKATIKAKYYFGSPVAEATVKYKVLREKYDDVWYPIRPWDWFYGRGYSWLAYDAGWLPGWRNWGLCRPAPFWFPRHLGPPEVVAEREVPIGADGTVGVEIDTSLADAMFPGESQKYSITAEVVDNSRRTIVGSGTVLVSKEPFKVYAWVNRGYYEPGQKIEANFQARRLDGKPVSGDAEVKVYKITYPTKEAGVSTPAYEAQETEVHTANVQFNENGVASLSLNAAEPGQYRVSCKLDGQEGGYVFSVYDRAGVDTPASLAWKYNALELIPERAEYAPGENVALRVNTDRQDAFVLLFVKASNGIALKPQILKLTGKSAQVEIPVEMRDMPNFFVEAITVSGGEVVNEMREIVVPPQKRILNVEVKPSAETYKPGQKAKADLVVTDLDGKPVVGQTVVSIYDKSVEYISGGSNVEDIREFFWKWRRHHHPGAASNLSKVFPNMPRPGKPGMQNLGVFGGVIREEVKLEGFATGVRHRHAAFADSLMLAESAVVPMAGAAPMRMAKSDVAADIYPVDGQMILQKSAFDADSSAEMVEPTIRSNFADTALWVGALETDENGRATIELEMPESLTTWKINVWSMGLGTRVGHGTAEVITRKDLIIRMQTPRFLIEKDRCIFSANVHNYLPNEKDARIILDLKSRGRSEAQSPDNADAVDNPETSLRCVSGSLEQRVKIPAGGEVRVDWTVEAKAAGDATVVMKALTDEESDAMQKTLPVYVHGMMKQEAFSGYISPDKESGSVEIRVPEERRPEQTKLTVRFSPTLAASMVDALPYLVDYPYGCTEQTLNRFLPTVIVQKILVDMNVDLEKFNATKTNLNAQELGEGRKPAIARKVEPVYDVEQVRKMVDDGVTKLANMQCSDGGWGWFGGYGERSSAHLTALVVHGLRLAHFNDIEIDATVVERGETWLRQYQKEQVELLKNASLSDEEKKNKRWKSRADETDAFVMMVLSSRSVMEKTGAMSDEMIRMREFLWRDRAKLSPYGVAMTGIGLHAWQIKDDKGDDKDKVAACVKMLEQYLVEDEENQTAHLNLARHSGWCWWAWHGSEFETQAYYLKLLMRTDPKSPVAPRLVKYLLNNRRHATYWNSTRDTAIVVETFAEFLKATGEDKPEMVVEVLFDGQVKKTVEITPENLFEIDNTLVLNAEEISSGTHKVELRKKGRGPLYFNAYLENFTLEDPIAKTGLEVKVERRIYKLVRDKSAKTQAAGGRGQVVEMKVEKYVRLAADPGSALISGDLVEIELIIESKNDYESILIEDMKAAGLEPVDVRSGYTGNELGAYVEFRDERVAMFVYRLPKGKHSVTYRLRAEQPGEFSALPTKISAMYAPELKGNSDENKIRIVDRALERGETKE